MSPRYRYSLHALALATVLALVGTARAEEPWPTPAVVRSMLVERAEAHGANPAEVLAVVSCETGGTFSPFVVGLAGEVGLFQWKPPASQTHWAHTPAWRDQRIDIVGAYRSRDPDATWLDLDQGAWSFGPEAQQLYPGNKRGWSCWR